MRKLTAISFALFVTVSAVAAPTHSGPRTTPNPVARIIRQIKTIIHALDLGQPVPPIPTSNQ